MADDDGPWAGPNPKPAPRPAPWRRRRGVALAVAAVAAAGAFALSRWFPGRLTSTADWSNLAQPLALLALVSASLFSRRLKLGEMARYISIWAAIAAVLLLGYTFRDEFAAVFARARSELIPSYAVATDPHGMVLTQGADGAYSVMGAVNGQPVRFVVDTGASDIVLSPADARRMGVDTASLNFSGVYETANGLGRGAPFTAGSLSVGPMTLSHVPVSINQAPMSASLLGMSFLKRLDSFEIRGRRLFLKWR